MGVAAVMTTKAQVAAEVEEAEANGRPLSSAAVRLSSARLDEDLLPGRKPGSLTGTVYMLKISV